MTSYFIDQFVSFIISPVGLAGSLIGFILLYSTTKSRRMAWLALSFCCFVASLSKYQNQFIKEPPSLVFPLQQLREMGRPLTIILVILLILTGLQQRRKYTLQMPRPIIYLVLVQTVILFKTLFYGSLSFALLAGIVFGAVVFMMRIGPLSWLNNQENLELGIWSMAMVGIIFLAINGYQAVFDIYPLIFVQGRFLGTTGNPQHAAVLLASTMPCLMFLLEREQGWWARICWNIGFALILGTLFLTGSRTGILMAIVTFILFYRRKVWLLLRVGIVVSLILALIFTIFVDQSADVWEAPLAQITGRIFVNPVEQFGSANSRQMVWSSLWESFQENPILGVELQGERLMGYGESSWLGAAAALGMVGLIPLVLFGVECLRMMFQLYLLGSKDSAYFLSTSVVIAGLASLLFGSFFEAYLLGNITFPLLALLLYLSMGEYLIHIAQYSASASIIKQSRFGMHKLRPIISV